MLRYAFRRMLWVFPSVIGVSIVTFYVLSLIGQGATGTTAERRRRFDDLPLFVNVHPMDVRDRLALAKDAIVTGATEQEKRAGEDEFLRLGGAALPILLPELDRLSSSDRVEVALALAPLADRMHLETAGATRDPKRVVLFWNRFWAARGVEFRAGTAESAVRRYAHYGTESRSEQLKVLDSFALPALFAALQTPTDESDVVVARRLCDMIAHVTSIDDRIASDASVDVASATVDRWLRWWMVYEPDFLRLVGADRLAAFLLHTQYGKWAYEAVAMRLGIDSQGRPLLSELLTRGVTTFTILALALALAYSLAIPLGALAAWYRGRALDRGIAVAVLVPYAASPALLASVALGYGATIDSPHVLAIVLLAATLIADPMRQQRTALLPTLGEHYVRGAIARGAGPLRVVMIHGLRPALVPMITRAALELPVAITGCFVLEMALGIDGLGAATIAAVSGQDHRWLMALSIAGAAWSVFALVLTDIGYAVLDPRLRANLSTHRRGGHE